MKLRQDYCQQFYFDSNEPDSASCTDRFCSYYGCYESPPKRQSMAFISPSAAGSTILSLLVAQILKYRDLESLLGRFSVLAIDNGAAERVEV